MIIQIYNRHVTPGKLIFIVAALSSTRSNKDQVTTPSEEDDFGTSDEVFLNP
jgi:hypothetical protein